jgi:hypothetical protein
MRAHFMKLTTFTLLIITPFFLNNCDILPLSLSQKELTMSKGQQKPPMQLAMSKGQQKPPMQLAMSKGQQKPPMQLAMSKGQQKPPMHLAFG